jgi:hypothetical protein
MVRMQIWTINGDFTNINDDDYESTKETMMRALAHDKTISFDAESSINIIPVSAIVRVEISKGR